MRLSIFCLLIITISINTFSQNCELTGTILDKASQEPIAYANVSIFSTKDSSLVAGAITDDVGKFEIDHIKTGKFQVKMSFIGYQSLLLNNVLLEPGVRDLGKTELQVSSENLNEISVKATKPPMTYKVDRKVIDAGSFPGAEAAIDLLENIPSVQVDIDGKLTYRGDGTFKVYINGHPVENGTEKLRQLPTSRIDKIEVITNPSAKYDAEGTAGIIQVILKKNRLEGYSINSSAKITDRGGYNWIFSIDNKTSTSGWYINGYVVNNVWDKYNETSTQTIESNESTYITSSDLNAKHDQKSTNLEVGFNYDLTDKDYIDFSGYIDPFKTKQKNEEKGWYSEQIINSDGTSTDTSYYMNSIYNCNYQYVGGTLTYEHAFNKDRSHLLSAYIDYSGYVTDLFEQQYDEQIYTNRTERDGYIGSEHKETMIEGKLNYSKPINDKITVDLGGEINTDHIPKITSVSGTFDENKNLTKNDNEPLNQKVDFIQDTYAPYIQLKRDGDKFAFQLGARLEYTQRRSDYSYTDDSGNIQTSPDRNNFTDFFPSAHLSYNFTDTHQLYTSYSRRIERPDYWTLIPLEQYQSPYSYYTGNGDVLPSYTDSYEVGYKKSWDKNFISAELFTRKTKNVIDDYTKNDGENMLIISPENVGKSYSSGVELMSGIDIFPWWNSNLNISLYNYKLDVEFEDEDYTQKQFKTDSRWNNTFILPKSFTLKWDIKYHSPKKEAQSFRSAYYTSNIALKKEFKDGKWITTIMYNDLFSSCEYDENESGDGFTIKTHTNEKTYFSFKVAFALDNQK